MRQMLETKPSESFKKQFSRSHHPQPINLVVPESSSKDATNETNAEGDEVKSQVEVANKTVAVDRNSEQRVVEERTLEEHGEDTQVESTDGEAFEQDWFLNQNRLGRAR